MGSRRNLPSQGLSSASVHSPRSRTGEAHVAVHFLSTVLLHLHKLPKTPISSTSSLSSPAEMGTGVPKEDAGRW